MSSKKVVTFTCDAPTGCTDEVTVPLQGGGLKLAVQEAKDLGWTSEIVEDGDYVPKVKDFCPVHKSHSGWDWQADYPTSPESSEDSDGLEGVDEG